MLDNKPVRIQNGAMAGLKEVGENPQEANVKEEREVTIIKENGIITESLEDSGYNEEENWKPIEASISGKNCRNFIREIVDNLNLEPNPDKPVIALSIGDPTIYGNLAPPQEAIAAMVASIQDGSYNGYAPCVGYQAAREAVAEYLNGEGTGRNFSFQDIILASGCSSALELCISALADPGKCLLIPRPGFPLYRTLAESIGVKVRTYDVLPSQSFQADLSQLSRQLQQKDVAAIVINNPSNPCGSVWSEQHLRDVLSLCHRHRVPVIADEIYEHLVFPGVTFVSAASVAQNVPILVCGGLAKRFIAPGWRMGWIAIHDPVNALQYTRKAILALSQRTIGSCTIIQGALPELLKNTPITYHQNLLNTLKRHADIAEEMLGQCKGLHPCPPQGTMYMMVEMKIEGFPWQSGLDMVKTMMEEESVFCLPGECFQFPGYFRIVLTVPEDLLREACQRIKDFCNRHFNENKLNA